MRLEERIVLDGAAAVVVEHAVQAMGDTCDADADINAKSTQDTQSAHEAKDVAQPGSTATPDVAALLKAVAPQHDQPINAAVPAQNNATTSIPTGNSQPEEDPVTVLVASGGLADVNDLLGAAKENVVTVTYDGDTDNPDDIFNKIESALDGKQAASIGFASHSIGSGAIQLADGYAVDADTLISNPELSDFWKNVGSLVESDGHIDLFGCGVAEGAEGKDLIVKLEQLTGREIAASIDDTGNVEVGGNWLLEEGNVDLTELYFDSDKLAAYENIMATSLRITLDNGGAAQTLYDSDGNGYYEIDTAEKLVALSRANVPETHFARRYELTADIVFDADETKVDWDGDGDVGDGDDLKGFRPIGYDTDSSSSGFQGTLFTGRFYGNGHSIKNLFIDRVSEDFVGLFGITNSSKIKDVAINGESYIAGRENVGGLIGRADHGEYKRNFVSADVKGNRRVGGLIGTLYSSELKNSYASCAVQYADSSKILSDAGGLVGEIRDTTISDCYSTSSVKGNQLGLGGSHSSSINLGGLVGVSWANGAIRYCYTTGAVNSESGANVGGVVGSQSDSSSVVACYALNPLLEGSIKLGRIIGDNSSGGELTNNRAKESMRMTGAVPVEKTLGGIDGRDYSSSKDSAYSSWSTSTWDTSNLTANGDPTLIVHNDGGSSGGSGSSSGNTAPELVRSGRMQDLPQDSTSPDGETVSSLISSKANDVDDDSLGVAIVGIDNTHGTWQYNVGSGWHNISSYHDSWATLLAPAAKIRFVPDKGWDGQTSILVRAWDQSDGRTSGRIADVRTNGGDTSYSSDSRSINLRVTIPESDEAGTANSGSSSDVNVIPDQINGNSDFANPMEVQDGMREWWFDKRLQQFSVVELVVGESHYVVSLDVHSDFAVIDPATGKDGSSKVSKDVLETINYARRSMSKDVDFDRVFSAFDMVDAFDDLAMQESAGAFIAEMSGLALGAVAGKADNIAGLFSAPAEHILNYKFSKEKAAAIIAKSYVKIAKESLVRANDIEMTINSLMENGLPVDISLINERAYLREISLYASSSASVVISDNGLLSRDTLDRFASSVRAAVGGVAGKLSNVVGSTLTATNIIGTAVDQVDMFTVEQEFLVDFFQKKRSLKHKYSIE